MFLIRQAIHLSDSKVVRAIRARVMRPGRSAGKAREAAVKAMARGIATSEHFTFDAVFRRFVGKKLAD